MKKIRAYIKVPWIPPSKVCIVLSKIEVIGQAMSYQSLATFIDSSLKNGLVSVGVQWQNLNCLDISMAISSS